MVTTGQRGRCGGTRERGGGAVATGGERKGGATRVPTGSGGRTDERSRGEELGHSILPWQQILVW